MINCLAEYLRYTIRLLEIPGSDLDYKTWCEFIFSSFSGHFTGDVLVGGSRLSGGRQAVVWTAS